MKLQGQRICSRKGFSEKPFQADQSVTTYANCQGGDFDSVKLTLPRFCASCRPLCLLLPASCFCQASHQAFVATFELKREARGVESAAKNRRMGLCSLKNAPYRPFLPLCRPVQLGVPSTNSPKRASQDCSIHHYTT